MTNQEAIDRIQEVLRDLEQPCFHGIAVPRRLFLRSSFHSRREWKKALATHSRFLNLPIRKIKEFAKP